MADKFTKNMEEIKKHIEELKAKHKGKKYPHKPKEGGSEARRDKRRKVDGK
jgi:hypothetical protein